MKRYPILLLAIFILMSCSTVSRITVEHDEDKSLIHIDGRSRYLVLPIQDKTKTVSVRSADADMSVPHMDIRLAVDAIDYYVPFKLPKGKGRKTVEVLGLANDAICWSQLRAADEIDWVVEEKYRPLFHFTPKTAWMNDPNGLVYKDGVYHMYYQHNPYGCKGGNLHWGHASSRNLVDWEHHDIVLYRDTLGHAFSGSSVVDHDNRAGFGKGAIVAFYTAHVNKRSPEEVQCIAYSNDGGMTFTKYEGNPVIVPHDGLNDFRDPKVFWYEPEEKWVMALAAYYELRFYSSKNLKDWEYTGCFGKGYGSQPSQFECPDLLKLPVDGGKNGEKWLLILNVSPGGLFGGSATQYFIGEFDGETFHCDTPQYVSKWLDYGKDHYAAVTFANTGDRAVSMAWMSNWRYGALVPTKQFRGAMALPRELKLFSVDGDVYASSAPVSEVAALWKKGKSIPDFDVESNSAKHLDISAYPVFHTSFNLTPSSQSETVLKLSNDAGENVKIIFDSEKVYVDRSESGLMTDHKHFADVIVSAPLSLCESKDGYDVDIYIDVASMELFVDGGRVAMTNILFPTTPYSQMTIESSGSVSFKGMTIRNVKNKLDCIVK